MKRSQESSAANVIPTSIYGTHRIPWRFGLTIALTAAVLTGCKVGPDYKRPEATSIPAAYTGATNVVATDTANIWKVAQPQAELAKGKWWEIFGDRELNE